MAHSRARISRLTVTYGGEPLPTGPAPAPPRTPPARPGSRLVAHSSGAVASGGLYHKHPKNVNRENDVPVFIWYENARGNDNCLVDLQIITANEETAEGPSPLRMRACMRPGPDRAHQAASAPDAIATHRHRQPKPPPPLPRGQASRPFRRTCRKARSL